MQQHDIPFKIFDRDQNIDARDQGWGITIQYVSLYSLEPNFRAFDSLSLEISLVLILR